MSVMKLEGRVSPCGGKLPTAFVQQGARGPTGCSPGSYRDNWEDCSLPQMGTASLWALSLRVSDIALVIRQ